MNSKSKIVQISPIIVVALFFAMPKHSHAQVGDDYMKSFQEFRNQMYSDYNNFLGQINADYAKFLREAWQDVKGNAPVPAPDPVPEPPTPPVVLPEDKPVPKPENKEVPVDVAPPQPQPSPKPVPPEPVREIPQTAPKLIDVVFYGCHEQLRYDIANVPFLAGTSNGDVADVWEKLCDGRANNLLIDCLELRDQHRLCDWAYHELVKNVAEVIYPNARYANERELMQMFILCQSGYKVHISKDNDGRLHTLVAADDLLYGYPYWEIEGQNYFLLDKDSPIRRLSVMEQSLPNDKAMRMTVREENRLGTQKYDSRLLKSEQYPEAMAQVTTNKQLITFYNNYPKCYRNNDPISHLWFYAQTPLSEISRKSLYPSLRSAINGKDKLDAVNVLLNFVQTAFEYGYDSQIWGQDRAFFAEETLYYPYSDCEDRAILFSRLVRDLTGLDVVLVFCPGHLFTAVQFPTPVDGDYIMVDGKRYTIADPTYIHAPVGLIMPDMDTSKLQAIIL